MPNSTPSHTEAHNFFKFCLPGSKTNRRNALGLSRVDFPKGFVVPKSFPKGFSARNSSRQKVRKVEADMSTYRDGLKRLNTKQSSLNLFQSFVLASAKIFYQTQEKLKKLKRMFY